MEALFFCPRSSSPETCSEDCICLLCNGMITSPSSLLFSFHRRKNSDNFQSDHRQRWTIHGLLLMEILNFCRKNQGVNMGYLLSLNHTCCEILHDFTNAGHSSFIPVSELTHSILGIMAFSCSSELQMSSLQLQVITITPS